MSPKDRIAALKAWAAKRRERNKAEPKAPPPRRAPHRPTAAQVRSVQQMLEAHSHEVANLSRPALAAMLPLLEQAKHEVARDLTSWLQRNPNGGERYTALKLSSQLVALHGSMSTIAKLGPALADVSADIRHDTAKLSTAHLIAEVGRMSAIFDGVDFRPRVNLAAIIAVGDHFLLPQHRTSAAHYAGDVMTDIRAELAKGMLLGESIQEMTDRLVKLGGPKDYVALRGIAGQPGAKGQVIAEGLFRRYRWWAERIVRDQVGAAYTFQALAGYFEARQQIPDLEKRWDASVDRRTCPACAELDGVTVPLDSLFPGGVDVPLHSCCRCRIGAWRAHWSGYMRMIDEEIRKAA